MSSESCPFIARSRLAVAGALLCAFAAGAFAVPSTQFAVGGQVQTPATYDFGSLSALPSVTQTVTFSSSGVPQTHVYTGAPIWNLLTASAIVVNPQVKNDVLDKVVVATGTDGYRAVFSAGELSPDFGNRQALAAYAETIGGSAQPLGTDGFARVTAPGDVRGGRYVSNLASLSVLDSASTAVGVGGGVSSRFTVSGDVLRPGSFDLAALQALPPVSVTAGSNVFTGASFWDFLETTVGLRIDANVKNDVLGMVAVATGSDGYKAAFSLGEIDPLFGNQPDLIAYGVDGTDLGSDGFARIVAPGDGKRGRYVSNLISLEVFHAAPVPEPSTWLLWLAGVALAVPLRRRGWLKPERAHGAG